MPHDTGNPWTVLDTRQVYENPWMRVVHHEVLTPKGTPGIYGVMSPRNLATGIVPIDAEGCTTLVGQYRFPLGQYSWEIRRELEEETGLTARHWLPILTMHLSTCLTDEVSYSYLAWGLEQGAASPDETEELQLRRVPFAGAYAMAMRGDITDRNGTVLAATEPAVAVTADPGLTSKRPGEFADVIAPYLGMTVNELNPLLTKPNTRFVYLKKKVPAMTYSRMAAELEWPSWPGFSSDAMRELQAFGWPGNVRELRNVVER